MLVPYKQKLPAKGSQLLSEYSSLGIDEYSYCHSIFFIISDESDFVSQVAKHFIVLSTFSTYFLFLFLCFFIRHLFNPSRFIYFGNSNLNLDCLKYYY